MCQILSTLKLTINSAHPIISLSIQRVCSIVVASVSNPIPRIIFEQKKTMNSDVMKSTIHLEIFLIPCIKKEITFDGMAMSNSAKK